MPGKKLSSAKCHICGERVPFTYGNPKELIHHMLGCHERGNRQNCNPSCSPNLGKPCVRIVDCPSKLPKCTTCGGKRQTAGKSATLYDVPEDAPKKCTICVSPSKKDSCGLDCPFKKTSNNRRSSTKNDNLYLSNCPNKPSSRINLGEFTGPVKLRIKCRSCKANDNKTNQSLDRRLSESSDKNKYIPVSSKIESSINKSETTPKYGEAEKNKRSSISRDKSNDSLNEKIKSSNSADKNRRSSNLSAGPADKNCIECRKKSSMEMNKKLSPSVNKYNNDLLDKSRRNSEIEKMKRTSTSASLNSGDKSKECFLEKCVLSTTPEKNRRLSNTLPDSVDKSTVCNKTVCFANSVTGGPEGGKHPVIQYSPCNLIKRKGTKEMYKTTLESWSAGCGNMNCPQCHRKVVPLIRKKKNKIAFTSAGASLLLTCWPFCFLIPMLHNCSVDLYCPCCKYKLGVYNSSTGKTTSVCCKENAPNT